MSSIFLILKYFHLFILLYPKYNALKLNFFFNFSSECKSKQTISICNSNNQKINLSHITLRNRHNGLFRLKCLIIYYINKNPNNTDTLKMLKNNASNFHFHIMINDHSLQLQSQTHFPLQNLNVFQFRLQMMAAVIVMTIPRAVIIVCMLKFWLFTSYCLSIAVHRSTICTCNKPHYCRPLYSHDFDCSPNSERCKSHVISLAFMYS